MDRNFEEIKQEALALDIDRQRDLVDVLESNLAASEGIDITALREVERRLDAYDRGEMEAVDLDEALTRVRKLIEL